MPDLTWPSNYTIYQLYTHTRHCHCSQNAPFTSSQAIVAACPHQPHSPNAINCSLGTTRKKAFAVAGKGGSDAVHGATNGASDDGAVP